MQRLFDALIAGGPDFIYSVILYVILANKSALEEYAEMNDRNTATFVIFKTPLRYFNTLENVELVIQNSQ